MSATSQVAGKPMDLGKLTGPNRSTERQDRPITKPLTPWESNLPDYLRIQGPRLETTDITGSCVSTKTSTGQGLGEKSCVAGTWRSTQSLRRRNFFMGNRCDSGNSGLYLSSQTIGSRFTDRYQRTPSPSLSGALGRTGFGHQRLSCSSLCAPWYSKSGCLKRFHSVTKISASTSLIAAY